MSNRLLWAFWWCNSQIRFGKCEPFRPCNQQANTGSHGPKRENSREPMWAPLKRWNCHRERYRQVAWSHLSKIWNLSLVPMEPHTKYFQNAQWKRRAYKNIAFSPLQEKTPSSWKSLLLLLWFRLVHLAQSWTHRGQRGVVPLANRCTLSIVEATIIWCRSIHTWNRHDSLYLSRVSCKDATWLSNSVTRFLSCLFSSTTLGSMEGSII